MTDSAQRDFTHTIDGQAETSDKSFDVINPATGAPFAQCPDASRDQLDHAVAAARQASHPLAGAMPGLSSLRSRFSSSPVSRASFAGKPVAAARDWPVRASEFGPGLQLAGKGGVGEQREQLRGGVSRPCPHSWCRVCRRIDTSKSVSIGVHSLPFPDASAVEHHDALSY